MEIQTSMADGRNSDKVLGRLEGYQALLADLQEIVKEKERVMAPLPHSSGIRNCRRSNGV